MTLGKGDQALGTSLVGKVEVVVHCIGLAQDDVRAHHPGELGACSQVEDAVAFLASRFGSEFPKGSVYGCILGHGSAVESAARALPRGLVSPCRAGLG